MRAVRDIIKEAAIRCNVGTRRQALPGGIEETAFRLLKGVVDKYNYDNLLAWTQNYFTCHTAPHIHIYDEFDSLKGENNLYFDNIDDLNAYSLTEDDYNNDVWAVSKDNLNGYWTVLPHSGSYLWSWHLADESQRFQEMIRYVNCKHIKIRNLGKINSIYVATNGSEYRDNCQLKYVAPADYDRYSRNSAVFTYTQKAEGEWLMQIKPVVASQNWMLKINYNETIQFDIDDELPIPENYAELLIVALAHKLAIQFPRLDDAQMQRLETEVRVMVDNVRTPKAEDRILSRSPYNFGIGEHTMTQDELLGGTWF